MQSERATTKSYYLNAMGIEQWVLQGTELAQPIACYGFQLFKNGQLLGVLLAESSSQDKKIHEMLLNICRALKVEARGEWYSATPDVSAVIKDCCFVIMMGEFSDVFGETPVIKTHSPERLLSEPLLKRKAWNDLQKVFSLMESH